ncbi:MAG: S49 family peptidase [Alphaproteobacteria bacterium]|nr:MAG: S49 family peptidase [Alphaproteobacteria bacterium]
MRWFSFLDTLVPRSPVVSVIRLYGAIGIAGRFGPALSDHMLAEVIERAFRRGRPAAVALAINSPGGSPVQSALIAARIRRLAEETGIPVYAFCEDVAASGGYWLATAADEIWADAGSILGSIGVISAGFGLQDLIARVGIERRVHTAGEQKSALDPFRPEDPAEVARLDAILKSLHESFIAQVRDRRGARLTGKGLFTGAFWIGTQAVKLGLADGIGHLVPVMKEKLGEKVRFRVTAPRRSLLQRLGGPGSESIHALPARLGEALEDRALWSRYGM